jgi:transposase-like protein
MVKSIDRYDRIDVFIGLDVAIPNLHSEIYFAEWLLERCKRAAAAMITVAAECYLAGVSTRRMEKLVKHLGIHPL